MAIAIRAKNLSKQYRLGNVGSNSLKDDTRRWWARLIGNEDPLLTLGDTNDRSTKGKSDYVWALKDINFEIKQGDTVGIVGRNGAGKSTLLKILSKVTAPTIGNININGRIASLLEVGTGFHGELTGRENIYLNGAIMGMRKHEISRKLDEIVDFAGVERYLDTPVKRYSSGMYVRLGFAVAVHLENEILIVDEVLAVGDAEFQKKCLDKLKDVSTAEGRTILFVSHNMQSLRTLCRSAILLEDGLLTYEGRIDQTIEKYVSNSKKKYLYTQKDNLIQIKNIQIGNGIKETSALEFNDSLIIKIDLFTPQKIDKPYFWLAVDSKFGSLFGANSLVDGLQFDSIDGDFSISYVFPNLKLMPQQYAISMGARGSDGSSFLMSSEEIATFNVVTPLQELGLNGLLAESLAPNSSPILYPYTITLNDTQKLEFNPDNLK